MDIKIKWDLSDLLLDKQAFYIEIDNINRLLSDIKEYEDKDLDAKLLLELLNRKWQIKELSNKLLVYGSLQYYKDVNNEECVELKRTAENFNSQVDSDLFFIDHKIISLGRDRIEYFFSIESGLEIYKQYLDNLFRMQEHIQNKDVNNIIQDNNKIISKELERYNSLLREIRFEPIEVEGEEIEITASNFAKYLASRDRKVRENAYLCVNESYQKEQNDFADILNYLYSLRIQNANLEQYDSILEKVLFVENIDSRIISSLIQSVNENLDLMQEYLKIKSDALNISDPHLYDFGVPLDNELKIKFTLEEAVEIIKKALRPLGEEYLKVVDKLLDGHIDAELDEKKHQHITFSWHTYSFMNFRGAYVDLKNMIHELGHIVNYYLSMKEQPFLYEDSTIFVGETASIINEILLNKYLYENAQTNEERIFYLSKNIENFFTSVFKQTMYTEFENKLYGIRLEGNLSPEILCEIYGNIVKKYYGKEICYDEVCNVEWTRLGHLYRWSYYPYKYATGLLMASIVVNDLTNEKTLTIEKYLEFLSSGSNKYSLELLKILNIDLTNPDVLNNGFKVLEDNINELKLLLNKKTNGVN